MTVSELIEKLSGLPGELEVITHDPFADDVTEERYEVETVIPGRTYVLLQLGARVGQEEL